jgi:hypothetical protein
MLSMNTTPRNDDMPGTGLSATDFADFTDGDITPNPGWGSAVMSRIPKKVSKGHLLDGVFILVNRSPFH